MRTALWSQLLLRDKKSAAPELTINWLGFDRLYTLFTRMWQALFFTINFHEANKFRRADGGHEMSHKPHVILYTKPGCHLCEEAKTEIERAGLADQYTFEEVDILTDPDLRRRYGYDIPVVLIDGTHAFKHRLTAAEFRQKIERQSRGR